MTLYIDVETAPDLEAVRTCTPPFDASEVKTGNLKDPTKVAEKLVEAESRYWRMAEAKAALNPLTARIIAVGIVDDDSPTPHILQGTEQEILGQLFALPTGTMLKYWGGSGARVGFDQAMILRRAALLGMTGIPFLLWENVTRIWTFGAPQDFCALASISAAMGLTGPGGIGMAKDSQEVTGEDFHRFWRGDATARAKAESYLTNDVVLLRAVARRLAVLPSQS